MKNMSLFYLCMIFINNLHGMENPTQTNEQHIYCLLEQLSNLKDIPSTFKKYQSFIETIEIKLWSETEDKLDILEYSLQMINQQNIDTILFTIDDRNLRLKNKINILNELHNLPHPHLEEDGYVLEKNKAEHNYWRNSKEKIKEHLSIKHKENKYETQKRTINLKQKTNKKISLEEWKEYQLTLMEYHNIADNIIKKQ